MKDSFKAVYNQEAYQMLINCIKCIKKEQDDYLDLAKQFLSLEYKKNAALILQNEALHIFDRLLFLKRFRPEKFQECLDTFLEKRRRQLSLEAIIFLFREKDLVKSILDNLLRRFHQTRTPRTIWRWSDSLPST